MTQLNSSQMVEVELAAYTDRLSGRPGDKIRLHVSSRSDSLITATLHRCICSDPNPDGPGVVECDASQWFPVKTFVGRHQKFCRGSFARSRDSIPVPEQSNQASVDVWIYPTRISRCNELRTSTQADTPNQCIWSWGDLGLFMKLNGCLVLCCDRMECIGSSQIFLLPNKWYHVTAAVQQTGNTRFHCTLKVILKDGLSKKLTTMFICENEVDTLCEMIPKNAQLQLATEGTFNGRLENPTITVSNDKTERDLTLCWDTSQNITEWTIPSKCASNSLQLHNHPTRAVKGHLWDGSEFCWRHNPNHYGAIHFHDDDVYDFSWDTDLEWTIPVCIPSGVYIIRLRNENGDEDALPLFICPPKNDRKTKKLCILIPTFTYVMYGNHARADFQKEWLDRIKDWNAYPHNASQYSHYGCSTYNYHSDDTGICFASHLRPLFNLRPKYLTFGSSSCSGLRHFPADTHLIAWMHNRDIEYDIVTDHELHKDGVSAIAQYQTIVMQRDNGHAMQT